jgi:outer membrane protein assembly factor BamB
LTVEDDTVYVISGAPQQVYGLQAESGNQQITFAPQGEYRGVAYWSPVALGGDLAFVGFGVSQDRTFGLYAFDPETGQEQWHVPVEDLILGAPVYEDGIVYFGASDGQAYAVDVEAQAIVTGWPFQAEEAIWASPLVAGGRVYVPAMDHHLYCLDADTGGLLWDFEAGGSLAAQPTLDAGRGIVYFGAFDGRVHALQAESGDVLDGFEFQADNWIWSKVLLADDLLFVTSLDGRLYALDPATGAVQPPYPYDSTGVSGQGQEEVLRASPVQAGDQIVIATESGRVMAVENAVQQWLWPSGIPEASVLTSPVAIGDRVYVLLTNGRVYALEADTGLQAWTFSPIVEE